MPAPEGDFDLMLSCRVNSNACRIFPAKRLILAAAPALSDTRHFYDGENSHLVDEYYEEKENNRQYPRKMG